MKKIFLAFSLIALVGCSTLEYKEPESGSVAKVRFITNTAAPTLVERYSDNKCKDGKEWMRLRDGYIVNSKPKSLSMPLPPNRHYNAFKEVLVKANTNHTYMFRVTTTDGFKEFKCGVLLNATFKKDKMYELDFRSKGVTCSVSLNDISTSSDNLPVRNLIRNYTNFPSEVFGKQCIDNFHDPDLF